MKKSLFKASFEESLNLEDDVFVQHYVKEQNEKQNRLPKNAFSSFKLKFYSLILTLLFPIGLNFMLIPILMLIREDANNLTLTISKQEFLTVEVYLCCLLIWLLFVLIGKKIKQIYLHPYRFHFHTMTYLIWLVLEFNLAAIELSLPTLSFWLISGGYIVIILIGYWMFKVKYRNIKNSLFTEKTRVTTQDKIAKLSAMYGSGVFAVAILVKQLSSIFVGGFSDSIKAIFLLLAWFVLNVGLVAMLIFMEFPYYLNAYYKWKYPEEYREWEGKSLEEWYGKSYLKKHQELLKREG